MGENSPDLATLLWSKWPRIFLNNLLFNVDSLKVNQLDCKIHIASLRVFRRVHDLVDRFNRNDTQGHENNAAIFHKVFAQKLKKASFTLK
jgi:hypothetical protein